MASIKTYRKATGVELASMDLTEERIQQAQADCGCIAITAAISFLLVECGFGLSDKFSVAIVA